MSVFMQSTAHVDALIGAVLASPDEGRSVRYGNPRRSLADDPGAAGRVLLTANAAALVAAYGDASGVAVAAGYEYRAPARRLSAVEALKALDGLEYQIDGVPGYPGSAAALIVAGMRSALVVSLPGYGVADMWAL